MSSALKDGIMLQPAIDPQLGQRNLTRATAPRLKAEAIEALAAGHRHLVVDFRGTEYADAAGLGQLLAVRSRTIEVGGHLVLVGLSEDLTALFEMTKIAPLFEILSAELWVKAGGAP